MLLGLLVVRLDLDVRPDLDVRLDLDVLLDRVDAPRTDPERQYDGSRQLDTSLAETLAGQANELEEENEPEDEQDEVCLLDVRRALFEAGILTEIEDGLRIDVIVAPVDLDLVVVEGVAVRGLEQESCQSRLTGVDMVEDGPVEVDAPYSRINSLERVGLGPVENLQLDSSLGASEDGRFWLVDDVPFVVDEATGGDKGGVDEAEVDLAHPVGLQVGSDFESERQSVAARQSRRGKEVSSQQPVASATASQMISAPPLTREALTSTPC